MRSYLRPDGVFLMRLIGHNTNTITVTEVRGEGGEVGEGGRRGKGGAWRGR